ncbi:hypothetical protein J7J62_07735 [bacterium]|nr:hypothetical protein [bacterium]
MEWIKEAGFFGLIMFIFSLIVSQIRSLRKEFRDGLKDITDNHLSTIYEKLEQHSREIAELSGFIRGILRRNKNENSSSIGHSR